MGNPERTFSKCKVKEPSIGFEFCWLVTDLSAFVGVYLYSYCTLLTFTRLYGSGGREKQEHV